MSYRPEQRRAAASEQQEQSAPDIRMAPADARNEFQRAMRDGLSAQEAADLAADKIAQKFVDQDLGQDRIELFKKDIGWPDDDNPGNYTLIYTALRNRLADVVAAATEAERTSSNTVEYSDNDPLAVDFSQAPKGDQRMRSEQPATDDEFDTLEIGVPQAKTPEEQPAPRITYLEDLGIQPKVEVRIPADPRQQFAEQESSINEPGDKTIEALEKDHQVIEGYLEEVAIILADPANREVPPDAAIVIVMQRHKNFEEVPRNVADALAAAAGETIRPRSPEGIRKLFQQYVRQELNLPTPEAQATRPQEASPQPKSSARELFDQPPEQLPESVDQRSADQKRLDELAEHFSAKFPDKVSQKELDAYVKTLPLEVLDPFMEGELKNQLVAGIEDQQERGNIRRIEDKTDLITRYLTKRHGNVTKPGFFGRLFGR